MFRTIRHKAPFILLGLSALLAVAKYYEFYAGWFVYLGDLIGYSIFTSLFMMSVYMNNRYCNATKITVLGLIALNMYNLASVGFNFYAPIYDFYIIGIVLAILIAYKIQPKEKLT